MTAQTLVVPVQLHSFESFCMNVFHWDMDVLGCDTQNLNVLDLCVPQAQMWEGWSLLAEGSGEGGTSSQPAHFGCGRRNSQSWESKGNQRFVPSSLSSHSILPLIQAAKKHPADAGNGLAWGRAGQDRGMPRKAQLSASNHRPTLEQLSCGNHFGVNLSAAFLSEINGA